MVVSNEDTSLYYEDLDEESVEEDNITSTEEQTKDGDAEALLAYLRGKKEVDGTYFLRYTEDVEGRLENLFWCDKKSRIDYKTFGHVLVFDSTYICNAYNTQLVMLIGINHDRKAVTFGCALVVNENESSFIWVLKQLVEARGGQKPETIVTDGDKAMANAINVVFPEDNIDYICCI